MAVPIFMIVSGYVSALSFQKNNITKIEKAYSMKAIIWKALRFIIPFLAVILIELVGINFMGHRYSLAESIALFLRGGEGPGSYYTPVMLQFIFIFPVIYFLIKKKDLQGLIICGGINITYEILQRVYGMNEVCYRMLMFRYVFVIAFGCYLAVGKEVIKFQYYIISLFLGLVFILVNSYLGYTPKIIIYWTSTSIIASLWIMPIISYMIVRLGKIHCKPLEILGKASYNIFLVQMVYYLVLNNISNLFSNQWLLLFTSIVVCTIGGIIFYYIETPVTRKIMQWKRKIEN